MGEAGGQENMPDPGDLFAQLFGGKAFEDWVGEISLGKVSNFKPGVVGDNSLIPSLTTRTFQRLS